MNKIYKIKLEPHGDDLFMPIPDELLESMDWKEGDSLEMTSQDNHYILKKATSPEE